MLHLAQVKKNEFSGVLELRSLARQHAENIWEVKSAEDVFIFTNTNSLNEGVLVLIDVSNTNEVVSVRDAQDWILNLVQHHLTSGLTPDFFQQEVERAEQWRQELTLQSQELARRNMEMEARQEQIQGLEEDLKREKKQLEVMAAKFKTQQEQIQGLEEQLKTKEEELKRLEANIKRKEENIKRKEEEIEN